MADYAAAAAQVASESAPASVQGGVLTTINPSSIASMSTLSSSSEMSMASTTAATSAAKTTNTITGGASSTTSASASAATTTKSSAGVGIKERSDVGALLGLAVFAGGLVALMA